MLVSNVAPPPAIPNMQNDVAQEVGFGSSTQEAHGSPETLAKLEPEPVHVILMDHTLTTAALEHGAEDCQHNQDQSDLNKGANGMDVEDAGAADCVLQHSSKAFCTELQSASDNRGASGPHDSLPAYPSNQNNACTTPSSCPVHPDDQSVLKAMHNTTQDAALHGLAQNKELQPTVLLSSVVPSKQLHEDAVSDLGQLQGLVTRLGKTRNAAVSQSAHGYSQASNARGQSCKRQLLLDLSTPGFQIKKHRKLPAKVPHQHNASYVRMDQVDIQDQGCRSKPFLDLAGASYAYKLGSQSDGGRGLCWPVHASPATDSGPLLHPLIAAETCVSGIDGVELCHRTNAVAACSGVAPPQGARRFQAAWFARELEKAAAVRHTFMTESERLTARQHHAMLSTQRNLHPHPSQQDRLEECDGMLLSSSWSCSETQRLFSTIQ